jgi:hypothetical protein
MLELLLEQLEVLASRFDEADIPLILAGGMGLYLRDLAFDADDRSPRYPVRPQSRSTEDLDVFLNARVIVDPDATGEIRQILDDLGYEPVEQNFKFARSIDSKANKSLKVDLLGVPPDESERDNVKISGFRIRPHGNKQLHGRLTEEAEDVDFGKIPIDLSNLQTGDTESATVYIPSSLNYLVLKLHAFRDRHDDESVDYGRHHAFDIFRIVTDMRASDWQQAKRHVQHAPDAPYLKEAARIRNEFFTMRTDRGLIRLRENTNYQERQEEFDGYLHDFINDLDDLLADVE